VVVVATHGVCVSTKWDRADGGKGINMCDTKAIINVHFCIKRAIMSTPFSIEKIPASRMIYCTKRVVIIIHSVQEIGGL